MNNIIEEIGKILKKNDIMYFIEYDDDKINILYSKIEEDD